jgi:hypothetical protein
MDGGPGGTPGGSGTRQWQDRLWTSLLNAKDKGQAHHMFSGFLNLRIFFTIFFFVSFFTI